MDLYIKQSWSCSSIYHIFEYLSLYHLTALFCGHPCRNHLPPGGQTLSGSGENPLCLFMWWIYSGATWLVALLISSSVLFSKWSFSSVERLRAGSPGDVSAPGQGWLKKLLEWERLICWDLLPAHPFNVTWWVAVSATSSMWVPAPCPAVPSFMAGNIPEQGDCLELRGSLWDWGVVVYLSLLCSSLSLLSQEDLLARKSCLV